MTKSHKWLLGVRLGLELLAGNIQASFADADDNKTVVNPVDPKRGVPHHDHVWTSKKDKHRDNPSKNGPKKPTDQKGAPANPTMAVAQTTDPTA